MYTVLLNISCLSAVLLNPDVSNFKMIPNVKKVFFKICVYTKCFKAPDNKESSSII
jgi:hypothetical protein